MKIFCQLILTVFFTTTALAQDNCNYFLTNGDSCRYKACKFLEESPSYFQLTKEYHEIKDKALEICPEYAIVYKQKSTAYLKTGDFIQWKVLIDKAVELNPSQNLDYRGWCRFQFFRDYKGAIEDIEELDRLLDYDIGYCQNGDYHLNIAKALCYKMIGKKEKAISIIIDQIKKDTSAVGLYDYLHLGVLYLENKEYEKALDAFTKQSSLNELAECQYYTALAYKYLNKQEEYLNSIKMAKSLYASSRYMLDMYTHHVDKVYEQEIENELALSLE